MCIVIIFIFMCDYASVGPSNAGQRIEMCDTTCRAEISNQSVNGQSKGVQVHYLGRFDANLPIRDL